MKTASQLFSSFADGYNIIELFSLSFYLVEDTFIVSSRGVCFVPKAYAGSVQPRVNPGRHSHEILSIPIGVFIV